MNNFEFLHELGEPLGQPLRIPCYKGLSQVRQTYRGLVRQIRRVSRVAKSMYQYLPTKNGNAFLEESESRFGTAAPMVNV